MEVVVFIHEEEIRQSLFPHISSWQKKWSARRITLIGLMSIVLISIALLIYSPFSLSGLGMVIVGGLSIVYWRHRTCVTFRVFGFGAAAWGLTVVVKTAFAMAFNQPVARALLACLPSYLADPLFWLYLGLLTGIFECGGVFALAYKTRLKEMGWAEALAFGIGFGAMEAMVLGFISYVSVIFAGSSGSSLLVIPAPIVERISAMFIHIFSNVLIILAVQLRKQFLFWESFFYKTAVDSMAAFGLLSFGVESLSHIYTLELFVASFGIVGVYGLSQLKRKFKDK